MNASIPYVLNLAHTGKSFFFFAETLSVTLVIRSGRRDESWKVQSSHPKFQEVKQLLNQASCDGHAKTRKDMRSRLGYRGLLVQLPEVLIDGDQTLNLQKLLLDTIPLDNKPLQASKQQALAEITKMEGSKKESDV